MPEEGTPEESPGKRRGRPSGYKVSPETRSKISSGLRKKNRKQKEAASVNKDVPIEVRAKVVKRDGGKCRGCHETDGLKIHTFVRPEQGGSVNDLDNLALLCPWCREMARQTGTKSASQVP